MDTYSIIGIVLFGIISSSVCQHYQPSQQQQQQYRQEAQPDPYSNYNRPPPPQILSHKQALNHDGNFKYLFTAENGLAQGETIAPDGSRNGGYQYIDPHGKKITVKYTAGKEGFRILEGDHIPKAPLPVAPQPAAYSHAPQQPYQAAAQHDDGQYRPQQQHYERPSVQYYNPVQSQAYAQPRPYQAAYQQPATATNEIDNKEPEYNDAPGKPHSFGSGYVFEFAG